MRHFALLAVVWPLAGCVGQTYWAFPSGRTTADFRQDEAHCNNASTNPRGCLAGLGYRQVSQHEYVAIQQRALSAQQGARRPVDIVAYDTVSGGMFIGKSRPVGGNRGSVTIEDPKSGNSCTGYAESTKLLPGVKGSLGMTELLCRDGRKIKGEFVYDTLSSGYGYGIDTQRRSYRFIFGDLNLDAEALKAQFSERITNEGEEPKRRAQELSF
jgi:hypothetical protein